MLCFSEKIYAGSEKFRSSVLCFMDKRAVEYQVFPSKVFFLSDGAEKFRRRTLLCCVVSEIFR